MDFQKFLKFLELFFSRAFLVYIRIPKIQIGHFNRKKVTAPQKSISSQLPTLIKKFDLSGNCEGTIS